MAVINRLFAVFPWAFPQQIARSKGRTRWSRNQRQDVEFIVSDLSSISYGHPAEIEAKKELVCIAN